MEQKARGLWTQTELDVGLRSLTNLLWDLGPVTSPACGCCLCP